MTSKERPKGAPPEQVRVGKDETYSFVLKRERESKLREIFDTISMVPPKRPQMPARSFRNGNFSALVQLLEEGGAELQVRYHSNDLSSPNYSEPHTRQLETPGSTAAEPPFEVTYVSVRKPFLRAEQHAFSIKGIQSWAEEMVAEVGGVIRPKPLHAPLLPQAIPVTRDATAAQKPPPTTLKIWGEAATDKSKSPGVLIPEVEAVDLTPPPPVPQDFSVADGTFWARRGKR